MDTPDPSAGGKLNAPAATSPLIDRERTPAAQPAAVAQPMPGFVELVVLVATLMGLNALAIDIMLPALGEIGAELGAATDNDRQNVLVAYLFGLGAAQLVYGPLGDRFGRRPVVLASLALYTIAGLAATLATSFEPLLIARFLQGVGGAGTRVLAVAIARDKFTGRKLAEVMSLAMMVFMAAPVFAPAIGQGILLIGEWRTIFTFLVAAGVVLSVWTVLRLPETLPVERRRTLALKSIIGGYREVIGTRIAAGYMVAMGLMFGALYSFISSSNQIFTEVFGLDGSFTLLFGLIAIALAIAALANSRLVGRYGMRRLSHGALLLYVGVGAVHGALALAGVDSLPVFIIMQATIMFLFGFINANFNAMAMEPLGHVAATASALIGFVSTVLGTAMGFIVGHSFDGTTVPLTVGTPLLGLAALAVVVLTERGQLFRPRNEPHRHP